MNNSYSIGVHYHRKKIQHSISIILSKLCSIEYYCKHYIHDETEIDKNKCDSDYEKLILSVLSPNMIVLTQQLIYNLNQLAKMTFKNDNILIIDTLDSRKLLMIFVVAFFNDMVCSHQVQYKDEVKINSRYIVILFNTINKKEYYNVIPFMTHLQVKLINHLVIFNIWQHYDKLYIVYESALLYLKLSFPESEIDDSIYNSCVNEEKTRIETNIKYLNDSSSVELFNILKVSNTNVKSCIKELYWLRIGYYLYKTTPDRTVIVEMFLKVKQMLQTLIQNKKALCEEIDDILDDSILINVISETDIDIDFFVKRCYYILEWISKLQSPEDDKRHDEFTTQFKDKLIQKTEFGELVPFYFRFVIDQLERIEVQKTEFMNVMKQHTPRLI